MRQCLARTLYRFFPFDLRGDWRLPALSPEIKLSCIINFYGRLDLLSGILHSLARQSLPHQSFEVLLVEDNGGTEAGRELAEQFSAQLPIRYFVLDSNYGRLGYARNFALGLCRGENVLFLDDDTVILQENFLHQVVAHFDATPQLDALVPRGSASFSLIEGRYDYHEPYFMTLRCLAYRRLSLAELGGFMSDFVGQEDVEFAIRFYMAGKIAENRADLNYFHPPLLVSNLRKPEAVGASFFRLKGRYPMVVWLLVLLNCSRHALLWLVPGRKNREQGRFGIGFLRGAFACALNRQGQRYV